MPTNASKAPTSLGELAVYAALVISQLATHLGDAFRAFGEGKPLPPSLFGPSPGGKKGTRGRNRVNGDKPKAKRDPTSFNLFVKLSIEASRAAGHTPEGNAGQGRFREATLEWRNMSIPARQAWTADHQEELAALIASKANDLPELPEPTPAPDSARATILEPAQDNTAAAEQGKPKKKKRKHHNTEARPDVQQPKTQLGEEPVKEKKKKKKKKRKHQDAAAEHPSA